MDGVSTEVSCFLGIKPLEDKSGEHVQRYTYSKFLSFKQSIALCEMALLNMYGTYLVVFYDFGDNFWRTNCWISILVNCSSILQRMVCTFSVTTIKQVIIYLEVLLTTLVEFGFANQLLTDFHYQVKQTDYILGYWLKFSWNFKKSFNECFPENCPIFNLVYIKRIFRYKFILYWNANELYPTVPQMVLYL